MILRVSTTFLREFHSFCSSPADSAADADDDAGSAAESQSLSDRLFISNAAFLSLKLKFSDPVIIARLTNSAAASESESADSTQNSRSSQSHSDSPSSLFRCFVRRVWPSDFLSSPDSVSFAVSPGLNFVASDYQCAAGNAEIRTLAEGTDSAISPLDPVNSSNSRFLLFPLSSVRFIDSTGISVTPSNFDSITLKSLNQNIPVKISTVSNYLSFFQDFMVFPGCQLNLPDGNSFAIIDEGKIIKITNKTSIKNIQPYHSYSEAANSSSAQIIPSLESLLSSSNSSSVRSLFDLLYLPLFYPDCFTHFNISPPCGLLLFGQPGVGKSWSVRLVSNAFGCSVIEISGSEIWNSSAGSAEESIRDSFDRARQLTANGGKPVIVFIDEIDVLCPQRTDFNLTSSRLVGQFLTCLDGINRNDRIFVIGATNFPNSIDAALRRPGRFDRELEIKPPTAEEREKILRFHSRSMKVSSNCDLALLASSCTGFVGADIEFLTREALIIAFKEKSEFIEMKHFLIAKSSIRASSQRETASKLDSDKLSWNAIGGLDAIKNELIQIFLWPFLHRDTFDRLGLSPSRGVILHGLPGTAKTTLVRIAARQANFAFFTFNSADIYDSFVGESERKIREIFRIARANIPAILFFDEFDALVGCRSGSNSASASETRLIATFLTELDGVESREGIFIVAATNRIDAIDSALLRPGRFDRSIQVPLPDSHDRELIFHVHTIGKGMENRLESIDFSHLSSLTAGFSGAQIESACREAAILTLRREIQSNCSEKIRMSDFIEGIKIVQRE